MSYHCEIKKEEEKKGGLAPFGCKISSQNFFCDALKVGLSLVNKNSNKKHLLKWNILKKKKTTRLIF